MTYILDLPKALPERRTAGGACGKAGRAVARFVNGRIHAWMVWRIVRTLQSMDDRTLRDIGMTRGEIEYRVRALMPCGEQ